eukprot:CAMPEP_0206548906 /NCGR_PEP_ID=MMETSP0325_2-20121206/14155_1 /ASSEMBLY_ACC=CAM_ASM_000347 /TAXON_ID=2866 /ORGANISM="Crypthecodinium cohnii, Strain Seligo" /LENGTH=573 /DNA_ID=CAMNT_0054048461 /DNA_START=219 /DNA_END=1942 /DNA_ORIENTATION=+
MAVQRARAKPPPPHVEEEFRHVTTLMLCGLPRRYQAQEVLVTLATFGACGGLNLLHVPTDVPVPSNLGFAVLNYESPEEASEARKALQGRTWPVIGPLKHFEIVAAQVQGFQANIEHCCHTIPRNSSLRNLPLVWDRGQGIPFTMAVDILARNEERNNRQLKKRWYQEEVKSLAQLASDLRHMQGRIEDVSHQLATVLPSNKKGESEDKNPVRLKQLSEGFQAAPKPSQISVPSWVKSPFGEKAQAQAFASGSAAADMLRQRPPLVGGGDRRLPAAAPCVGGYATPPVQEQPEAVADSNNTSNNNSSNNNSNNNDDATDGMDREPTGSSTHHRDPTSPCGGNPSSFPPVSSVNSSSNNNNNSNANAISNAIGNGNNSGSGLDDRSGHSSNTENVGEGADTVGSVSGMVRDTGQPPTQVGQNSQRISESQVPQLSHRPTCPVTDNLWADDDDLDAHSEASNAPEPEPQPEVSLEDFRSGPTPSHQLRSTTHLHHHRLHLHQQQQQQKHLRRHQRREFFGQQQNVQQWPQPQVYGSQLPDTLGSNFDSTGPGAYPGYEQAQRTVEDLLLQLASNK